MGSLPHQAIHQCSYSASRLLLQFVVPNVELCADYLPCSGASSPAVQSCCSRLFSGVICCKLVLEIATVSSSFHCCSRTVFGAAWCEVCCCFVAVLAPKQCCPAGFLVQIRLKSCSTNQGNILTSITIDQLLIFDKKHAVMMLSEVVPALLCASLIQNKLFFFVMYMSLTCAVFFSQSIEVSFFRLLIANQCLFDWKLACMF